MLELMTPSEALRGGFELPAEAAAEPAARPDAAAVANGTTAFIAYGIVAGDLGLLLPARTVGAFVEHGLMVRRLPNTPAWLTGVANYNGSVVPVFNLNEMLELDCGDRAADKTLIIGQDENAVAVLVADRPVRMRLIPSEHLRSRPPLPAALQPYARACFKSERVWVSWDVEGFFSAFGKRV